jgi:hypothetical protein
MDPIPRVLRRVFSFAARRAGEWRAERSRRRSPSGTEVRQRVEPTRPSHADEATIRDMAEQQMGGTSSAESRDAYLRGDHPGGLHEGGPGATGVKRGDEEESLDADRDTLSPGDELRK